ncbi:hypothetical protein CEXT_69831 [Caerostris extrusa]|uniref:Uncharacterized protein n=1 Tax=Caerostris extrusa TaxID=172846 RepID=A0AAV4NWL0_CAEEX|nr:hypothetical protein CEXT_69831 [Caerostris extrusa]
MLLWVELTCKAYLKNTKWRRSTAIIFSIFASLVINKNMDFQESHGQIMHLHSPRLSVKRKSPVELPTDSGAETKAWACLPTLGEQSQNQWCGHSHVFMTSSINVELTCADKELEQHLNWDLYLCESKKSELPPILNLLYL